MNNSVMKCVLVPEDIIRSVKDERNRSIAGKDYSAVSNAALFMDKKNVTYLSKYIYLKHRHNGGSLPEGLFCRAMPELMRMWSMKENIDAFDGGFNWVLTLDYINNKFVKDHVEYYTSEGSDTNVFQAVIPVGTMNEYDGCVYNTKMYKEMTAADYQNLDVYGPLRTFVSDSSGPYRNSNRIPVNQKSMSKRQFSRENDGLRSEHWARASLEAPIRGYDMSKILAATGRYNDLDWTEI